MNPAMAADATTRLVAESCEGRSCELMNACPPYLACDQVTEKHAGQRPAARASGPGPVPRLVTVTSRGPGVAYSATLTSTVTCVGVTSCTTAVVPDPNDTLTGARKPWPSTVTATCVDPEATEGGCTVLKSGSSACATKTSNAPLVSGVTMFRAFEE